MADHEEFICCPKNTVCGYNDPFPSLHPNISELLDGGWWQLMMHNIYRSIKFVLGHRSQVFAKIGSGPNFPLKLEVNLCRISRQWLLDAAWLVANRGTNRHKGHDPIVVKQDFQIVLTEVTTAGSAVCCHWTCCWWLARQGACNNKIQQNHGNAWYLPG